MAKTRCKPGDRAKVIKARNPENIGLIVCVVRPYKDNERIEGSTWVLDGFPWVVVALSRRLAGANTIGSSKGSIDFTRSGVIDDAFLVPLDDNDAGTTITTAKRKPRARKQTTLA